MRILVYFPIPYFETPCFKKLSSIVEKGTFFMRVLLTENDSTFVRSLEPSEALLLELLSFSEFIKFITDNDSLLSQSLSSIFFAFDAIFSNLRF